MVSSMRTAGGANVHALRREILFEGPAHLEMSRGLKHSIRSVEIYGVAARACRASARPVCRSQNPSTWTPVGQPG